MKVVLEPYDSFKRMEYIREHKTDQYDTPDLFIIVGLREHPDNKPHFHVFRTDEDGYAWTNSSALLLKENKLLKHGKTTNDLTKDEIDAINQFLTSSFHDISIWKRILNLWNVCNHKNPVPENISIPLYEYPMEEISINIRDHEEIETFKCF